MKIDWLNVWLSFVAHKRLWALVGVLLLLALIFWAYSGGSGKDETPYITNIGVDQGKNAVIGNLVANQQGVVNNAELNANQAVNNLHNAINRPANSYDGNRANERYCLNFPTDPGCPPK